MIAPLVSVIILTFNGKEYIKGCLSSLFEQSYLNMEVIVVDNASEDVTPELIEHQFLSVTLIRNSSNLGYAEGNNVGIRLAHGDYIVLLNQDTKADKQWIGELVKVAERAKEIGMCASKLLYMDEPARLNSSGMLLYRDLSIVNRGIGDIDNAQYDQLEEVFAAHGAGAFYRRTMLNEVGLLDDKYFLLSEEIDLAFRARFAGWKCIYVPTAVVYHARSPHTGLHSPLKLYYGERNRIWTVVKYLPFPLVISSFFFTLRRYMAMIFFALRSKKKKAQVAREHSLIKLGITLIRAWLDAFRDLPEMIAKRHQIQLTKKVSNQEIKSWLKQYSATLKDVVEK
jgi:GT2 family glycosyltransferase